MDDDFVPSYQDSGVSASDKFVTVSNGSRRVEVPDGEGYLMAVETTDSSGLPDGRYDLSKAIEARAQADRSYDGQVLHTDKESVYHLVGEEVVKHSMFEVAKHSVPEIGAKFAVAYAGGVPQVAQSMVATSHAAEQLAATPQTAPTVSEHAGLVPREQVTRDLEALFKVDPRAVDKVPTAADMAQTPQAGGHFDGISTRLNASGDYAGELKKLSPGLYEKLATPETKALVETKEKMARAVEVAERADQLKTLTGKGGEKTATTGHDGREQERRGFSVPSQIKTSVEARVRQAQDLVHQSHTLQPLYGPKPNREGAHKQPKQQVIKPKRGMSR
ncbi:KfrB domain-containing protein [Ralstonia sp. OTU4908]|jgi:hypothetical protein|uniref:KfrB domain-containing protein n=1 Tax=Ralstonia sp. OTU4908 TaxID=3043851 RepID=UPI00313DB38E